jgi:hypothetical protein
MIIQSLSMEIRLIPQGDTLGIELVAELAGLLPMSRPENETNLPKAAGSIKLVAGGRSKLNLRADDPTQVKLVAGAHNQLNLMIFAPDFSAWRYAR